MPRVLLLLRQSAGQHGIRIVGSSSRSWNRFANQRVDRGQRGVRGVVEVDSEQKRHFNKDDEEFLCGLAAVLGKAIESKRRRAAEATAQLEPQVRWREREALFRELQHRVANDFQSLLGVIEIARRRVTDPGALQGFDRIMDRLAAIVIAREQLSLRDIEKDLNLDLYLTRSTDDRARPGGGGRSACRFFR